MFGNIKIHFVEFIVDEDEDIAEVHSEGAGMVPFGRVAGGADPLDVFFGEVFFAAQGGVGSAQGDQLFGEFEQLPVFFEQGPVDP